MTSAGLRGPGRACRWRAWPGESWIASGAASTSVRMAAAMSSIPAREGPSLKKPWSTATSKQRPSAANRRLRLGSMAPSLSEIPRAPTPARRGHIVSCRSLFAHPLADKAAEVGEETLLLVRRIGAANGVHEQAVEVGRVDPVEDHLVDVREPAVAEVVVALDLEVLVRQLPVSGQLLLVRQVLAVADLEVVAGGGGGVRGGGRGHARNPPSPTG